MDILRRELNEIYLGQGLGEEHLSEQVVREALRKARAFSELSKCSVVVTDIASDKSFFLLGTYIRLYGSYREPKGSGGVGVER